jgi:hypothetical protein
MCSGAYEKWKTEKTRADIADKGERETEQKLNDLTKPNLKATVFGDFMDGSFMRNAMLIFQMSVSNTGAPSTFSIGDARLTLTNGKVVVLSELPRMFGKYVDGQTVKGQPFNVRLADADRLILRSRGSPVEKGGAISGWIGFVVPGMSQPEMIKEMFRIDLTLYDVNGKEFTVQEQLR